MVDLSSQIINKTAPYQVVSSGNGVVRFITDNALVYEAGFTDDYTFLEENAYQFYLKEITGNSSSHDVKIMQTVGAIIEEFFAKNQSVVLYFCDTVDGKQAVRDRLFSSWYELSENRMKYTFLHGGAEFDGVSYFASVLIKNDNPDLDEVIQAFNSFKLLIKGKYPDVILY